LFFVTIAGEGARVPSAAKMAALPGALSSQVLAYRNEFHLRRDDAALCVMHLRHARTLLGAQRCSPERRKIFKTSFVFLSRLIRRVETQITIVDRLNQAAFVFFDIIPADDPIAAQLRETFANVGLNRWIAVWSSGIVNAHGRVFFQLILEVARWVLIDLAEWDAHAGLRAVDVDAARVGELSSGFRVSSFEFGGCGAHSVTPCVLSPASRASQIS